MKKYSVFSVVLMLLVGTVPIQTAQEAVSIKQGQSAKEELAKLTLKQKILRPFSESIARLKKCAKFQCNRSEILKTLRDVGIVVGIAVGLMLAAGVTYKYVMSQGTKKKWDNFMGAGKTLGTMGQPKGYWLQLIHNTDRNDPFRPFALAERAIISHDNRIIGPIIDRFNFTDQQVLSLLYRAVRMQYADALTKLLKRATEKQINRSIEGQTLYNEAKRLQQGSARREAGSGRNPYNEIVAILNDDPKVSKAEPKKKGVADLRFGYELYGDSRHWGGEVSGIGVSSTSPASPYYKP